MTKAELLKQKHVIIPLGGGKYATHLEDSAGHKYETNTDEPTEATQYRLLKANMTDASWVDFTPSAVETPQAKGQAVPDEVAQAEASEATIGASDVGTSTGGNTVGATDVDVPPDEKYTPYQPPETASTETP